VARVAYLTNPDNTATLDVLAEMKLAAAAAGVALIGVEFGSASDFDAALAVMLRERIEVLLVSNDPLHQLHGRCETRSINLMWIIPQSHSADRV
jgi:ABC-type uncharacterized transport system substrate-binding protein